LLEVLGGVGVLVLHRRGERGGRALRRVGKLLSVPRAHERVNAVRSLSLS
jgi:hypothetical protein